MKGVTSWEVWKTVEPHAVRISNVSSVGPLLLSPDQTWLEVCDNGAENPFSHVDRLNCEVPCISVKDGTEACGGFNFLLIYSRLPNIDYCERGLCKDGCCK